MLRKINNYHLFILILIVFILNTILFKSIDITKAQWQPPEGAPGQGTANIVTSPLLGDLNLGTKSIIGEGNINLTNGAYKINDLTMINWDVNNNRINIPQNLNINNSILTIDGVLIDTDSQWNIDNNEEIDYLVPLSEANYAINTNSSYGYLQDNVIILNTDSDGNTFVGRGSGANVNPGVLNTFLGYESGYNSTAGYLNIFLGYKAGYNEIGNNKLYIANSDTATPLIYGDFQTGNLINNGMFQVQYALNDNAKNLIYANALTNSSRGSLMLLENDQEEKYKVDLEGNLHIRGIPMFICKGNCPGINGDDGGEGHGDDH